MSVPSCVTFRDQEISITEGRPCFGNWSRLETFCHIIAARKAIRNTMDGFEEVLVDGLKIAKELYRRGAIYRSSVDNCDPAQFANIPEYTVNKNSFFSSMFRSIENSFKNWFVLLEVLRMYPECREKTDELEEAYRKELQIIQVEKYTGEIKLVSLDEAKVLFESICDEFEALWSEARGMIENLDLERLRKNVDSCYHSEPNKPDSTKLSREEMIQKLREHLDMMNISSFDTIMMGCDQSTFHDKIKSYVQFRALTAARISIKDFTYQLKNNPKHKPINFGDEPSMEFRVTWNDSEPMFRYFFLIEVVFFTLTRHQYYHHYDPDTKGFWFHLPDWVKYAMVKLTREKMYALVNEGVCRVNVENEITVPDQTWDFAESDYYDFMNSVIRINQNRTDEVDETLQGLKAFRRWESNDEDRRIDSVLDFTDEWPESVPLAPQVFTVANFMTLYETNHVWISHPFYTKKRGFKFCLMVYPRGIRNGLDTHLSIGTCLMRGENDDRLRFPVRGSFTIRLLNQLGDHSHIERKFVYDDKTRPEACERVKDCNDFARIGVSFTQFAPLSILDYNEEYGTQYLVNNDSIYIQLMHSDFTHRSNTFF